MRKEIKARDTRKRDRKDTQAITSIRSHYEYFILSEIGSSENV